MTITDGYKRNFETLKTAKDNDDLCLLEVYERKNGNPAVLVCATYKDEEENINFVPLARMLDTNPYKTYVTVKENIAKYEGTVDGDERSVVCLGTRELLPKCLDVVTHSPDGFNWGYEGSGPAQLALAILVHHCEDTERALEHYQQFKREVIAHMPQEEPWTLSAGEIDAWLSHAEGGEETKTATKTDEGASGLVNAFGQPISSKTEDP